jgi:transposase-like protein
VDRKKKVALGAAAVLAAVGGGAAIAATQIGSPSQESQAVVNDAAKQLGVTPTALSNALKKALMNRVDAAVAAGQITKSEGDALKQRIQSGDVPLFFGAFGHPAHPGENLSAAASYLGVTADQLRSDLESGKTLAQIAKDKGKSVDGLVNALYNAQKKELDQAVADGRLTKDQEQSILANLKNMITAKVNGTERERYGLHFGLHLDRFRGGLNGFRGHFQGPPPAFLGPTT